MNLKSKATGIFAAAVLSIGMTGGAMAQAVGTEADLSVNVENTDEVEGVFTFGFTQGAFSLSDVEVSDEEGAIAEGDVELYVEDTREDHGAWGIHMSSTGFNNADAPEQSLLGHIPNSYMGVAVGDPDRSSSEGTIIRGLAYGNMGSSKRMLTGFSSFQGTATQSSGLSLVVPAGTESGTYTATLSLTATGDIDGDADNGDENDD